MWERDIAVGGKSTLGYSASISVAKPWMVRPDVDHSTGFSTMLGLMQSCCLDVVWVLLGCFFGCFLDVLYTLFSC